METTVVRKGQVTQLTHKEQKNTCVISFKGGYCKFYFEDVDAPDGLMLKDKVEISIRFKDEEP